MAYCGIEAVEARNPVRGQYTRSTKPNASQVVRFINEIAGEIDMALINAGYAVPVATVGLASSVAVFLESANAAGAAYKVEWAAPTSDRRGEYEDMYQSALKMIGRGELPGLGKDAAASNPRGAPIATSLFQRDMDL